MFVGLIPYCINMKQEKIVETIKQLVNGNLAWCDPDSKVCQQQHERHPVSFPKGSTFESAEEVLNDIIHDLTALEDELNINASLTSAQL